VYTPRARIFKFHLSAIINHQSSAIFDGLMAGNLHHGAQRDQSQEQS